MKAQVRRFGGRFPGGWPPIKKTSKTRARKSPQLFELGLIDCGSKSRDIMNLGLAFLALHSVYGSSRLSPSSVSQLSTPSCHFLHVFRPFLVGGSPIRASLLAPSFSYILSSATRVSELKDSQPTSRTASSSDLRVSRCQFARIQSEQVGGAVYCSGSLTVFNSRFDSCQAKQGGAISCTGALRLDMATFSQCRALEGGAVEVRTEHNRDCGIVLSLFARNVADYFGSVYRMSRGLFRVLSVNFTRWHCQRCVGCMEGKYGTFELRHSLVSESAAASHNGGICTRLFDTISIEYCHFLRNAHISNENDAAAALLFYDNAFESTLTACTFVENRPSGSFTLTVGSGHTLMVTDCCFSGTRSKEVNPKNIAMERCLFSQGQCDNVII
jgi:hypothetical protein